MKEGSVIERAMVKENTKWTEEEHRTIETIQKSHLRISRIVFEKSNPEKRCIAFSKNRKSIAFDIEMVPLAINLMVKLTPMYLIPDEFMTEDLKKVWRLLSK